MMRRSDPNPSRDIERLSAFLDGDLSPIEVERLEARLRQEADLRRLLEELRYTVAQLKGLPEVKAPRNFTLTPATAGIKPRREPLFSFFRFASAVAAVALAVVVGLDVMMASGGLPALSIAAQDSGQEVTMFNDEGLRTVPPGVEEADMAEPMAMQATEEDQVFGESEVEEEAPLEAEGAGTADCDDCPTESDGDAGLGAPTLEYRQDLSAEATATAKAEQTGAETGLDDQVEFAQAELESRTDAFWTPIRVVEVSLAALVMVLVVLTIATRRQFS
jgi:hypothetical protein